MTEKNQALVRDVMTIGFYSVGIGAGAILGLAALLFAA